MTIWEAVNLLSRSLIAVAAARFDNLRQLIVKLQLDLVENVAADG